MATVNNDPAIADLMSTLNSGLGRLAELGVNTGGGGGAAAPAAAPAAAAAPGAQPAANAATGAQANTGDPAVDFVLNNNLTANALTLAPGTFDFSTMQASLGSMLDFVSARQELARKKLAVMMNQGNVDELSIAAIQQELKSAEQLSELTAGLTQKESEKADAWIQVIGR